MSTRIRLIALLAAALFATLAASPLARAADPPVPLGEAFRQIKDAERSIPVPTPVATVNIGTFDAATGEFDGLAVETMIVNGKPVRIVPKVFVNAVNARLVFGLRNATQLVRLSVTGVGSAIATAGRTSIAIDVGRLRDVKWSLTSGLKIHRDQLTITRPRIIGAGVFAIRALPIGIVYDPPQDPARSNSVVYTRTTSIGTTLGLSIRRSTSTTTPAVAPKFTEADLFHNLLKESAFFASVTGNSAVATALGKIDTLIGKAQRNVTTISDGTSSTRRTYTFTESHSCSLAPGVEHLGPGRSDMIVYLRNVRLVWLDNGTSTFLQVLGYDSLECATIDQLRSGVAALDPASAAALIALDPFAGLLGPKAPLAGDSRYVSLPGIGLLPGLVHTATYTQQLLLENSRLETSTRTVTDQVGGGFLAIVGLGPSETQQVASTLAVSNEASTTESTTVTTSATLRTLVDGEHTGLSVFYDRVFGNVAFQDPRP